MSRLRRVAGERPAGDAHLANPAPPDDAVPGAAAGFQPLIELLPGGEEGAQGSPSDPPPGPPVEGLLREEPPASTAADTVALLLTASGSPPVAAGGASPARAAQAETPPAAARAPASPPDPAPPAVANSSPPRPKEPAPPAATSSEPAPALPSPPPDVRPTSFRSGLRTLARRRTPDWTGGRLADLGTPPAGCDPPSTQGFQGTWVQYLAARAERGAGETAQAPDLPALAAPRGAPTTSPGVTPTVAVAAEVAPGPAPSPVPASAPPTAPPAPAPATPAAVPNLAETFAPAPTSSRIQIPTSDGGLVRGNVRMDDDGVGVRVVLAVGDEDTGRSMASAHVLLRQRMAEEGYLLQGFVVRCGGRELVHLEGDGGLAGSEGGASPQESPDSPASEGDAERHPIEEETAAEPGPAAPGWVL